MFFEVGFFRRARPWFYCSHKTCWKRSQQPSGFLSSPVFGDNMSISDPQIKMRDAAGADKVSESEFLSGPACRLIFVWYSCYLSASSCEISRARWELLLGNFSLHHRGGQLQQLKTLLKLYINKILFLMGVWKLFSVVFTACKLESLEAVPYIYICPAYIGPIIGWDWRPARS